MMSCLQVHLKQHHDATADSSLSEYSYVCIQHTSVIATVTLSTATIRSNSCQPQPSVNSTQPTALSDQPSQSSHQGHSGHHEGHPLLAPPGPLHPAHPER